MMQLPDSDYYIQGILDKNRRILSQTITLIESSLKIHKTLAKQVLDKLMPHTGNSIRIGITGVPGAGKSTFIENLGLILAEQGHQVAVMAVDPSSRKMGGSIMGDKTRMEKLAFHKNTFIRPSPSGNTLGGVAAKTRETMLACEAAGFDVILVETVGVGQSEISVAFMVDCFLALMISGAGDELQGIKRGVLEVADAIVVNKADGKNIDLAIKAKLELEMAMNMIMPASPVWHTPVLTCSSVTPKGTWGVWETILEHQKKMKQTGDFELRRQQQALDWMWNLVDQGLKSRFKENENISKLIPLLAEKVRSEQISPSSAADKMLALL